MTKQLTLPVLTLAICLHVFPTYGQEGVDSSTWSQLDKLDRTGVLRMIESQKTKKNWPDVLRAAQILVSRDPKDVEALTALGEAQGKTQKRNPKIKTPESVETLKKALEINPKYEPAYLQLVEIYDKNAYEKRLLYQDMIDHLGAKAPYLTQLCILDADGGFNDEAEKDCKRGIAADGSVPDNYVYLGLAAKNSDDLPKAEKRLREAATKFPSSELAQYQAGSFLESQKNYVDAFNFYEACVRADANSERCLTGEGNAGAQLKKYEASLAAFEKSCRKNNRNGTFIRRAGAIARQGKEIEWADKFETLADRCHFLSGG